MKIAEGIEAVELTATNFAGAASVIHPTLFQENGSSVLVDVGYPGTVPKIRSAIEKSGLPFATLGVVIITHHDLDHIGGLAGLRNELPESLAVFSHAEEKRYIQGELPPIKQTPERLAQREAQLKKLPIKQRRSLKLLLATPTATTVDRTLSDGDFLEFSGGISIIHTPGHTPGHICLYHHTSKTLVSGDALNLTNGKLVGPNPLHTYDLATALTSLKKLADFDIEYVICYHGGVYQGSGINQRIAELADGKY